MQRADKVERNEYRGAVISGLYDRTGDNRKKLLEVKIYEEPQKKPLERFLFHSLCAILSCHSFPAFCLFIYSSSAITVNYVFVLSEY